MTELFLSKALEEFKSDVKSSATWDMSVRTSPCTFGSRRVEEVVDMLSRRSELMVVRRGESMSKLSCMVKADIDVEVRCPWLDDYWLHGAF